jgi:hypothetical protein
VRITWRNVRLTLVGIGAALSLAACGQIPDVTSAADSAVSAANDAVSQANDVATQADEVASAAQSAVQSPNVTELYRRCGTYNEPKTNQPVEEIACNGNGVPVFGDANGAPPPPNVETRIPIGTHMHITCRTSAKQAGMDSVAEFYRIADGPWKDLYAPADTFLNEGYSVNQRIPQCTA